MESCFDRDEESIADDDSRVSGNGVNDLNIKGNIDNEISGLHAINLVVDLKNYSTNQSDRNLTETVTEKEGEFEVSDLVWGKVKSYPWWPGQIFDPSASTNKAMKYFKKDGFFIAFFGDQSFAFNESFNIKPFRINFGKMANQTNSEAFVQAVECALHEVARRVEFGLACLCLSEEVYEKVKSQVVVNDGIRKEFCRLDGGDRFSTVDSFKPVKVVDFIQDLAKDPFGFNRLEVVTVRGQLSSFNRWKGYHQLQLTEVLDESDNNKLNTRGRARKHKHLFDGDLSPSKKVRCLSDLMSDDEYKPKKRGRKRKNIESNVSSNESQSQTAEEFLSRIFAFARNPMEKQRNRDSVIKFSYEFRNYRVEKNVDETEEIVNQPETIEADGFTGIKDSYWTDRIILTNSDEPEKENSATSLIFKFTNLDSVPSVRNLNEIFRRYGALQEEETRVLKRNNCVKVVFERRSDAEMAFSSSGKFSIFGPSLVSYRLNYSPTPRKTPAVAKMQDKTGVKSAKKAMRFEN